MSKLSNKVIDEIIDAIEQGKAVNALHRENPQRYPERTTLFRMRQKDKELNERICEAYRNQAEGYVEAHQILVNNPPQSIGDKARDAHYMKIWTQQVRSAEFKITRIGPIFNSQLYNQNQKMDVQHTVSVVPVLDYSVVEETNNQLLTGDTVQLKHK
jgi:hypothetical protein